MLALVALVVIRWLQTDDAVTTAHGIAPERRRITSPAARLASAVLGWGLAIFLLLPHLTLLLISFVPIGTWTTELLPPVLSTVNYQELFSEPERLRPMLNSLWMASVAAFGAVALGFVASRQAIRHGGRLGAVLEGLIALPWAIPGTVFALALLTTFSVHAPLQLRFLWASTAVILPLAYLVRCLPITGRSALAGLRQLDPALEEAAAVPRCRSLAHPLAGGAAARPPGALRRGRPRLHHRSRRFRHLDRALHLHHPADLDRDHVGPAGPGVRHRLGLRRAADAALGRCLRPLGPRRGGVSEEAHDEKPLELSKLWVLMVTAFVDMIGFALIVPLLPFYALEFGASATTVGFLMAIFAFGQMTTAPLWGRLSDRIGRKPVLMASQGLSAVAFLVFAYADAIWLLFLCRLLQGIGSGTLGAVSAYVTDAVGPDERAKALGWITACTSAGVMVGPAIGSLTVGWSTAAPGLIAAGLCGVNLLFTWGYLGEARAIDRSKPRPARRRLLGEIGQVLTHPAVPVHRLIWVYTAGMMAFMSMTGIMALYLDAAFGIDKETVGFFYVAIGAVSVVMRGLILGRMVDIFGEVRTLRAGAICLGLGMIGMTLPATPVGFALVMLLAPTGTALLFPSTTSLVTRYADPDHVGQTVGVQQAFGGVSRLLAPIWAGAVFEMVGIREPFWIGGAMVLTAFVVSLGLRPGETPRRRRVRRAAEAAARAEAETPTEV